MRALVTLQAVPKGAISLTGSALGRHSHSFVKVHRGSEDNQKPDLSVNRTAPSTQTLWISGWADAASPILKIHFAGPQHEIKAAIRQVFSGPAFN